METTSLWTTLIKGVDAGVAEAFDQAKQVYQLEGGMLRLFNGKSTDQDRIVISGKTPAGELTKRTQGNEASQKNRFKLFDTTYVPVEYAGYIEVTKRTLRTRAFAGIFDESKDLTIAGRLSQDKSLAQVFNAAFNTTVTVNGYDISRYGDSDPLCSTVHGRADGGADQSNASSTSIVFNNTNLETGLLAVIEVLNDDGSPVSVMGKPTIVNPPALNKEVYQAINSELQADNANNNINYYKGAVSNNLMTNFLSGATGFGGSNTAWFIVYPDRAQLRKYTLWDLELDRDRDVKSGTWTYVIDAAWAFGHSDWRYTWGSQGTGAAYSS